MAASINVANYQDYTKAEYFRGDSFATVYENKIGEGVPVPVYVDQSASANQMYWYGVKLTKTDGAIDTCLPFQVNTRINWGPATEEILTFSQNSGTPFPFGVTADNKFGLIHVVETTETAYPNNTDFQTIWANLASKATGRLSTSYKVSNVNPQGSFSIFDGKLICSRLVTGGGTGFQYLGASLTKDEAISDMCKIATELNTNNSDENLFSAGGYSWRLRCFTVADFRKSPHTFTLETLGYPNYITSIARIDTNTSTFIFYLADPDTQAIYLLDNNPASATYGLMNYSGSPLTSFNSQLYYELVE